MSARRICRMCGRDEPDYITSPSYCPARPDRGYCEWREPGERDRARPNDEQQEQQVIVTYDDLLPFDLGGFRKLLTPPGFVLQNTFLTDSGGVTGSMLICVWTRGPRQ